jgi:regulator of RNase E activity RraB
MTDNWDSYLCEVEGKPASLLVDLGAVVHAPVLRLPYLAYVAISVADPDANGFPRREELETLSHLEDALEAALTLGEAAAHVGRCITDGHFELVYYAAGPENWNDRVAAVMEQHPGCAWEAGVRYEPAWDSYLGFLFPGEQDLLAIQNRRIRRHLREQGDRPEKIRRIRHWLDFDNADAGRAFCAAAQKLGFFVEAADADPVSSGVGETATDPAGLPGGGQGLARLALTRLGALPPALHVRLERPDAPENIDAVSFSLADLAAEHGGEYQGWSCPIEL